MRTKKISEIQVSYRPKLIGTEKIETSANAYKYLISQFPRRTIGLQESFVALYLNRANNILGCHHSSIGGLSGTVADIRILLAVALKSMASKIIISHNHPSGNLYPSSADKEMTAKIKEACRVMDIMLLDHIIVSPIGNKYFSFTDEGIL